MGIGILGIGIYLPPEIRTNEYWTDESISKWGTRQGHRMTSGAEASDGPKTAGEHAVLEALTKQASDPFRGTRQRRVMAPTDCAVDLETRAAIEAIARAKITSNDIDVVMSFSLCPDYINTTHSSAVHHSIGLRANCLSFDMSAVCNSFQYQLTLAVALIESGKARNCLLLMSSPMSRMHNMEDPQSTWFGDGAAAVIVGSVSAKNGILASVHKTDGSINKALVHGIPDKRWYDEGRVIMYSENRSHSRQMILRICDMAEQTMAEVLKQVGLYPRDVNFFVAHQSTAWMQDTIQKHIGLTSAKTVSTFQWAGSLSAANIPFALAVADREGLLREGDIVAMFSPGTGVTYSSTILRWGH